MARKNKKKKQPIRIIDPTVKPPVSLIESTSPLEGHGTCIRCHSQERFLNSLYCFNCYMEKTAPKPKKIAYSKNVCDRNRDYDDIISTGLEKEYATDKKQYASKKRQDRGKLKLDHKVFLTQEDISKLSLSMFNGKSVFYEKGCLKRYLKVYDDYGTKKDVVVWIDKRRDRAYVSLDENQYFTDEIRQIFKKNATNSSTKINSSNKDKQKSNSKGSMIFSGGRELKVSKKGDCVNIFYQDEHEEINCDIELHSFIDMIKYY